MSLKLCFNNEIHRVSKLPVSISALNETVASTFPTLSGPWSLLYDDSEGDRVTLKTDDDLKTFYQEAKSSGKSARIIVSTSNSVDRRKESIMSDKSFEVIYNVQQELPPPREEQKVSEISGDKAFVPKDDDPEFKKLNWMEHLPTRVRVFKLQKKLLSGKLEGALKEKAEKEAVELKAKLSPEDLQWLEKRMSCLDEHGVCQKKFRKGSHSRSKDRALSPRKEAKKISKRLFFMKSVSPDEKKDLEARLIELEAVLTPEEKEHIASKQSKWAEMAEKRKEKKHKFVKDFSAFLKDNIEGVLEISGFGHHGHHGHHGKHFKHHGVMKSLTKELLETYQALPEEKKAVVGELLNGIPDKLIAVSKDKEEKKCVWKGMNKEQKCEWKAKKDEWRMKRHQEHAEKKAERSREKKSREKKSKSPEKKTPNPPLVREARKFSPNTEKKIALLKEIFPEIDEEQAKIFIDANKGLSVDELIQSMITSTVKK